MPPRRFRWRLLFGALGVWLGYPLADPIIGQKMQAASLAHLVTMAARLSIGLSPKT